MPKGDGVSDPKDSAAQNKDNRRQREAVNSE